MTQFVSFDESMKNPLNGIYHIGVQGNSGTIFKVIIGEQENDIVLGPMGQWEVYSNDLKNMGIKIALEDNSQLGYIEYDGEGENK